MQIHWVQKKVAVLTKAPSQTGTLPPHDPAFLALSISRSFPVHILLEFDRNNLNLPQHRRADNQLEQHAGLSLSLSKPLKQKAHNSTRISVQVKRPIWARECSTT